MYRNLLSEKQTEIPMATSWLHLSDERMVVMLARTKEMNYALLTEMNLACLLGCLTAQKTASTAICILVCPYHQLETNNSSLLRI